MSISTYLSYRNIKETYENLDNKKRLIALIASLVIIIIFWYLFLMMPLQRKSNKVNSNAQNKLSSQIKTAQTTMIKLIQATQSPGNDEKEAHALYYDHLEKLYSKNKIDVNIDNVIKKLLNNRYGLELNGFENNELPTPQKFKSQKKRFKPYLINLSFSGSFLQMASYLKQFENPELPLYFKNLSFSLTKYPNGRLRLSILTAVADKNIPDSEETKE